jgi:amidase
MSLLLVAVRQVIRRSPEIEAQIGAALGRCRCYTGHMGSLAEETRWVDGVESAAMIARGDVTPAELLDAAIERIESDNDRLNAVSVSWFEHARSVAADPALPEGPFRGVPFLLKDLYAQFAGQPLTNGNVALKKAGHVADFDTTLVSRYKAAGLVIAGRTNSPEMGTVPTTEPLAHGPTRNPWNTGRTPGGSSGGAAAAVAAGMVPFAHASDGGGSIRIPASCCGLVGLKPSRGRISMAPARDEAALSVEHCVSRTVGDTAALLDATHGPGVGDTLSAPSPGRPYLDEIGADPGRLRIGLLDHHPHDGGLLDIECADAARTAAKMLESLGHDVEPGFPAALTDPTIGEHFGAMWAAMAGVSRANIGAVIGREPGPDDIEPMNWAMAEYASQLTATHLLQAINAQMAFRRRIQAWWAEGWDLLLTPTLAELPLELGTLANDPDDPTAPHRRSGVFVPFTPAYNISGQPAISLPLGWSNDGLPIGVQLVAAYGREDVLLRVAAQLESAHPWSDRHPRADPR